MIGAAIGLAAFGCYLAAVIALIAHGARAAEAALDEPIDLVPADDLMAVADAVQDGRPPVFVDEYLAARDLQLWAIENGWANQ